MFLTVKYTTNGFRSLTFIKHMQVFITYSSRDRLKREDTPQYVSCVSVSGFDRDDSTYSRSLLLSPGGPSGPGLS